MILQQICICHVFADSAKKVLIFRCRYETFMCKYDLFLGCFVFEHFSKFGTNCSAIYRCRYKIFICRYDLFLGCLVYTPECLVSTPKCLVSTILWQWNQIHEMCISVAISGHLSWFYDTSYVWLHLKILWTTFRDYSYLHLNHSCLHLNNRFYTFCH